MKNTNTSDSIGSAVLGAYPEVSRARVHRDEEVPRRVSNLDSGGIANVNSPGGSNVRDGVDIAITNPLTRHLIPASWVQSAYLLR